VSLQHKLQVPQLLSVIVRPPRPASRYLPQSFARYETGNGRKPTSLPPQPGCWIVAHHIFGMAFVERCQRHAPLACAVDVVRWGANASSDRLNQRAVPRAPTKRQVTCPKIPDSQCTPTDDRYANEHAAGRTKRRQNKCAMPTIKMLAAARKRIWGASIRANMGTSPVPHPTQMSYSESGIMSTGKAASFPRSTWPASLVCSIKWEHELAGRLQAGRAYAVPTSPPSPFCRRPTTRQWKKLPCRISASDRNGRSGPIGRCALCYSTIAERRSDSTTGCGRVLS
jgi:hypothetical protein